MRRQKPRLAVLLGALGVAALLSASGASVAAETQPIAPKISYAVAGQYIDVTVANPARTWTLEGQRVAIIYWTADRLPIRTFGPEVRKWRRSPSDPLRASRPHDVVECCVLPTLGPGERHVFRLWRVYNVEIGDIEIQPWEGPPKWTRG